MTFSRFLRSCLCSLLQWQRCRLFLTTGLIDTLRRSFTRSAPSWPPDVSCENEAICSCLERIVLSLRQSRSNSSSAIPCIVLSNWRRKAPADFFFFFFLNKIYYQPRLLEGLRDTFSRQAFFHVVSLIPICCTLRSSEHFPWVCVSIPRNWAHAVEQWMIAW